MEKSKSFEERYVEGETPWELNRADGNLISVIDAHNIASGMALDIGCGSGDNVIWLVQRGFTVVGCDSSPTAIEQAQYKTSKAGINCSLHALDFLAEPVPLSPFDFIFDRGCFHSVDEHARQVFAARCAENLTEKGLWLSLIGNADQVRKEGGPPQLSASQITSVIEPHFKILRISAALFDSELDPPPRCWICLMQRR
nr:class I SAM-dependent methyltransferase [Desulfobulbaceae bacterium]